MYSEMSQRAIKGSQSELSQGIMNIPRIERHYCIPAYTDEKIVFDNEVPLAEKTLEVKSAVL